MSLILELDADLEQLLRSRAASRGLSIEDYMRDLLDAPQPERLSPEQWEREFEAWADGFPDVAALPDEALGRESMYPDRL